MSSWRATQANSCVVSVFWLQTGFPVSPAPRLVPVLENMRSVCVCLLRRKPAAVVARVPDTASPLQSPPLLWETRPAARLLLHAGLQNTPSGLPPPASAHAGPPCPMRSSFPVLSHSHQLLSGVTHPSPKNPPGPPASGLTDRMNE